MVIKKLYDKVYLREDLGWFETIEFAYSLGFPYSADCLDEDWETCVDPLESEAIDYLNNLNIFTHEQSLQEVE